MGDNHSPFNIFTKQNRKFRKDIDKYKLKCYNRTNSSEIEEVSL